MPAPAAVNRAMTPLEWGMLIGLSGLWGGSFFFNALAVRELPTLTIVVGRVTLAALALLVILRARGQRLPTDARVWRAFFAMGFLNNVVPFSLIVWGQGHLASGVASILNATMPLFMVVVAHVLTADEKMSGGRLVGVAVGFTGVVAMVGADSLSGSAFTTLAPLACLGGALSYAFAGVYGRRFRAWGVAPMMTATGQIVASSIMLLPAALIVDRPWTLPMPGGAALGAVAGIALLSTALAYTLYFRILATAGATNLSLVTFLIPVSAILLGVGVLGETLLPRHLAGMALIGLGLAAIDGRPWRRLSALFARDGA